MRHDPIHFDPDTGWRLRDRLQRRSNRRRRFRRLAIIATLAGIATGLALAVTLA